MRENSLESEWAMSALEAVDSALPAPYNALLCIVGSADSGTAQIGVAVAPGLDRAFVAKLLTQLAAQYAEEMAEVAA